MDQNILRCLLVYTSLNTIFIGLSYNNGVLYICSSLFGCLISIDNCMFTDRLPSNEKNSDPFDQTNPKSRPVGIIVFAHIVRTSVRPSPLFQSRKTKQQKTICFLLAWLWVWPSGSLMTSVLYELFLRNLSLTKELAVEAKHAKPSEIQNKTFFFQVFHCSIWRIQ